MTTQTVPTRTSEWRLPASRKSRFARSGSVLYPCATLVVGLLAWEALVIAFGIPEYLLPRVSRVLGAIVEHKMAMLHDSVVTAGEILLGFLASVVVGVPLGISIANFRPVERAVYPLLVASQAIPKVAIAPLFIVWLGFGLLPKVAIAFLIAFFPVVVNTVVGLRSTPPEYFYLLRSMGATASQTFFKISLPHALPSIFAGLKVAMALAVVGAIVGEFVGADRGLGYLLQVASGQLNTTLLFGGLVVLSALGILLYYAVDGLERVLLRWHVSMRH